MSLSHRQLGKALGHLQQLTSLTVHLLRMC